MAWARGLAGLAFLGLALFTVAAWAIESDPLPVPQGTPRELSVKVYNEGVVRLMSRDFAVAQRHFEHALRLDETLAEAHNNLAYSLRMQGQQNFKRALRHYNRAIELKPGLAQAYMYRGVLFMQMGDLASARRDRDQLLVLDPKLAEQLDKALAAPATGEDKAGIAPQY